jgi:RNA polymerase sigma-70 factor, ECF subfamily
MGGHPPVDEPTLARALAAGEEDAFRALIERDTRYVFRICHRILGRVEDAEDATQETFMLAYRALRTFRGGNARAWLARIATRESYRRATASRGLQAATTALDEGVMATVPDGADHVRDLLAAEQREAVRRSVRALPEPYREVVAMRFFGELSLPDIAATTGRPLGTVKAQLYRGLNRLRRSIEAGKDRP